MKPESALVDVLDKLMERGAVLDADLIITVAGIPLIGLQIRAVLASMETMLRYGIMEDWDESTRECYSRRRIVSSPGGISGGETRIVPDAPVRDHPILCPGRRSDRV